MAKRDIVFILGYARSGTSALTRVISLCGLGLPERVFGATDLNPTGHWEPVLATNLNLEFLSGHAAVDDPRMVLEDAQISDEQREGFVQKIQRFLASCPMGPLVVKEFRINELTEFWLEAARREGYAPKAVIALRSPEEVARSIGAGSRVFSAGSEAPTKAHMASVDTTNAFWLKTNLLAERHSRGIPRVVVEYPNLLKNWRSEVVRVGRALAVDLHPNDPAIDDFLKPSLHRQRGSCAVTETFCYSWMTRAYTVFSAAARDAPFDEKELDEIYSSYRVAARTFGIIWKSFNCEQNAKDVQVFIDSLPIWNAGCDFQIE